MAFDAFFFFFFFFFQQHSQSIALISDSAEFPIVKRENVTGHAIFPTYRRLLLTLIYTVLHSTRHCYGKSRMHGNIGRDRGRKVELGWWEVKASLRESNLRPQVLFLTTLLERWQLSATLESSLLSSSSLPQVLQLSRLLRKTFVMEFRDNYYCCYYFSKLAKKTNSYLTRCLAFLVWACECLRVERELFAFPTRLIFARNFVTFVRIINFHEASRILFVFSSWQYGIWNDTFS